MGVIMLLVFVARGFTNREVREQLAQSLGVSPANVTRGMMTYNLRRLKHHGLVEKVPGTNRYRVTQKGLRVATLYTRAYQHILVLPFAQAFDRYPANIPPPLSRAFIKLDTETSRLFDSSKLAA